MITDNNDDLELITEGEIEFKRYLDLYKLHYAKDVLFGRNKPDYLVQTINGQVLCEVADFGETNFDRVVLKDKYEFLKGYEHILTPEASAKLNSELARLSTVQGSSAGSWDPIPRIQEILKEKGKQLKYAKGKIPCVLVIYNPGYAPNDYDLIIRQGIGNNRFFGKNFNTTFAAMTILDTPEGADPCLRTYYNNHSVKRLPLGTFPGEQNLEVDQDSLWDKGIVDPR